MGMVQVLMVCKVYMKPSLSPVHFSTSERSNNQDSLQRGKLNFFWISKLNKQAITFSWDNISSLQKQGQAVRMYPSWIGGWNRKLEPQMDTLCYNNVFERELAAVLLYWHGVPRSIVGTSPWETGMSDALWLLGFPRSCHRSCGGAAPWHGGGLRGDSSPRHAALAHSSQLHTPLLCLPACGGSESPVSLVVLFPSLPCRQYSAVLKEGLGSLLFSQAFFLLMKRGKTTRSLFGSVWPSCGLRVM